MRSSYKHPLLWMPVIIGVVFALIGWLTNRGQGNYISLTVEVGGLMIAGFFTLCGIANFIGTRFAIEAEFTKWLPSRIVAGVCLLDFVALMLLMFLGSESKLVMPICYITVASIILGVPAMFFVRGMTPPTASDS